MYHEYRPGGRGTRHVSAGLRFEAYLRELPAARVLSRFGPKEGKGRRILSSAELVRISREFSTAENLKAVFEALSPHARLRVAEGYLFLLDGINGGEVADVGEELLDSFLVYAVRAADGAVSYRGFDEFEPLLRPHVSACLAEQRRESRRTTHVWHHPVHVVNDLVLTIMLASQQLLQTTKSGALAKAAYTTAHAVLHYGTSMWRKELHRTVAMFIEYGETHGLLRKHDDTVVVARAGLMAWLAHDPLANFRDIVSFCTSNHRPWHWPLARDAFVAAGGDGRSQWYRGEEEGPIREGMRIGEALGLMAVTKAGGAHLFAAHPDPVDILGKRDSYVRDITIMPDFTAVISQETHPALLHGFYEIGQISGLDQVYRGTICREAVTESLTAGVSEDELLGRLTSWQAPANVVETAKEWIHEYRRLGIPHEQVVLTADASLAGHLAALDQLRDSVRLIPAGGVLRIRPGREREVRRVLASLGFDVRMPGLASQLAEGAVADELGRGGGQQQEQRLVTSVERSATKQRRLSTGGKYGSELKELAPSELDHVIDYAIIMGCQVRFEYEGSPSVKRGLYTVVPRSFSSGSEGALEGEDVRTGTTKRFMRARIKSIGVIES